MEQLAREKISAQQRLATLRRDGSCVLPVDSSNASSHLASLPLQHRPDSNQGQTSSHRSADLLQPTLHRTTVHQLNNLPQQLKSSLSPSSGSPGLAELAGSALREASTAKLSPSSLTTNALTGNQLKRRGSVSPDNETTTTASGELTFFCRSSADVVSFFGNPVSYRVFCHVPDILIG